MNPDLTKQIADRLSKLHDENVDLAHPCTEVSHTAALEHGVLTLNVNDQPLMEVSTMHVGAFPAGARIVKADGGVAPAFSATIGDGLVASPSNPVNYGHSVQSTLSTSHHNLPPDQAVTVNGIVPITVDSVSEMPLDDSDEVDEEFWQALGMKGPEDMTPDKLTEITKKLQDFQRSLKRMQRENPTTMGMAVRVKHRTPKKRKRKH